MFRSIPIAAMRRSDPLGQAGRQPLRTRHAQEVVALLVIGVLLALGAENAFAAELETQAPAASTADAEPPAASGVRRALIVCGHSGDEEHRAAFVNTVDSLRDSLVQRLGFAEEAVVVLFGGEEVPADAPRPSAVSGDSTRESIDAAVEGLRQQLRPEDTLWVIVLGHSYFDGRHAWFNLPGPDVDEQVFGQWFQGLACREQVFWITLPASGFYIKPLAAAGRVVVTATEADREINETTFPHELAKLLAAPPTADELDVDKDSTISVFDLYVALARRIAKLYADQKQLLTEHAQLDDNGDGRGAEVQIDYLSEELGGRSADGPLVPRPATADGAASAHLPVPLQPATPVPADQPVGSDTPS